MQSSFLHIHPQVKQALHDRQAVVALESTLLCHGLPWPENLDLAQALEDVIRKSGAVPACIALLDGQAHIGLDQKILEMICREGSQAIKTATRDMSWVLANRALGATTVSATIWLAHKAGIRFFATGGIGGVHREGEQNFDISADLVELSRIPVAVVSAGAKIILDLGRTLEYLETMGVPVIGFRTSYFPAFYSATSPWPVPHQAVSIDELAQVTRQHFRLGLPSGLLIANPIPVAHEIPSPVLEAWVQQALLSAREQVISGKKITPFLLEYLHRHSNGRTVQANVALVLHNADLAAQLAVRVIPELS